MADRQSVRQVVAALIRKDGQLLVVQEQELNDAVPHWSVPGGVVEDGELLHEALMREVFEETGLELISIGKLAYIVQFDNPTSHEGHEIANRSFSYTTFVFEIDRYSGELRKPIEGDVVKASQFLSITDALGKFEQLRFQVMREPLMAFLRGDVRPGSIWLFRRQEDGSDKLIAKL